MALISFGSFIILNFIFLHSIYNYTNYTVYTSLNPDFFQLYLYKHLNIVCNWLRSIPVNGYTLISSGFYYEHLHCLTGHMSM